MRPPRPGSRTGKGKSDAIDAVAAARTVLGSDLESLLQPRADGGRNALHILVNARRSMDTQRSADRHALTALARTMDLGIDARKPPTDAQSWPSAAGAHAPSMSAQPVLRAPRPGAWPQPSSTSPPARMKTRANSPKPWRTWPRGFWTCTASDPSPRQSSSPPTHTTDLSVPKPPLPPWRREPDPGLLRQHQPPPPQPTQ